MMEHGTAASQPDERDAGVTLDHERQQRAQEYARISRRLTLVDLLVGAPYLALWLATGWHTALRDFVAGVSASPWVNVPLYALLFGLPYFLIGLPLSYYSGFVLPHRYGQSNQTPGEWVADQAKGLALSGVLGLILLEVVYWLLHAAPGLWWLYAAGVMLFFSVVLATLAPVVIAPLFYKFAPLEDEELARRLERLGESVGIEVEGVYRFDMSRRTKSANAAVMGLGRTRRIVLGDTLLENFTHDEIETVLNLDQHLARRVLEQLFVGEAAPVGGFVAAVREPGVVGEQRQVHQRTDDNRQGQCVAAHQRGGQGRQQDEAQHRPGRPQREREARHAGRDQRGDDHSHEQFVLDIRELRHQHAGSAPECAEQHVDRGELAVVARVVVFVGRGALPAPEMHDERRIQQQTSHSAPPTYSEG